MMAVKCHALAQQIESSIAPAVVVALTAIVFALGRLWR